MRSGRRLLSSFRISGVIGGTVVPNYNFVLEIDLLVERAFNCLGNILLMIVSNDENASLYVHVPEPSEFKL